MDSKLPQLSPVENRVLGCLIEKELSTPEYYPLSLKALTQACNQKTNREPVLSLEETEVVGGLDRLRRLGLAARDAEGGRVSKYIHNLPGKLGLERAEIAVLAELLLRGPQTVGELRARTERMHRFEDLSAVEGVLEALAAREPPVVLKLPRRPGRKEYRYAHLLSGIAAEEAASPEPAPDDASFDPGMDGRVARLEGEVASLRAQVEALGREMEAFRAQFE